MFAPFDTADRVIHAKVREAPFQIPLSEVQMLRVKRRELRKAATAGLVAGIAVAIAAVFAAIVVALKGSCPFVLHRRGFDRLHLDETKAPDQVTLNRIAAEPGAVSPFSAESYSRWKAVPR